MWTSTSTPTFRRKQQKNIPYWLYILYFFFFLCWTIMALRSQSTLPPLNYLVWQECMPSDRTFITKITFFSSLSGNKLKLATSWLWQWAPSNRVRGSSPQTNYRGRKRKRKECTQTKPKLFSAYINFNKYIHDPPKLATTLSPQIDNTHQIPFNSNVREVPIYSLI